jgi:hypothetical protein
MHVDWSIERQGEFMMLMLGECVIVLLMVDFYPTQRFVTTYLNCYVLIALMGLVLFTSIPTDANMHAMRRSISRTTFNMTLVSIQGSFFEC